MEHWKLTMAEPEESEEPDARSGTTGASQPSTSWLEEPTVVPTCRSTRQPLRRARTVASRGTQSLAWVAVDRWVRVLWKPATEAEARISALGWWRLHESEHPLVAQVARRLLSLQASSAASERSFSKGGLIVSKKRHCLSGARVDGLSLVGWYHDEEYMRAIEGEGVEVPRRKKRCIG